MMDMDSIECVSSSDGLDEDEIHPHHNTLHPHPHQHHPEFSSSKPRSNVANNTSIAGPNAIAPATSVHELLECPVCTNSMYPPIHQVFFLNLSLFTLQFLYTWIVSGVSFCFDVICVFRFGYWWFSSLLFFCSIWMISGLLGCFEWICRIGFWLIWWIRYIWDSLYLLELRYGTGFTMNYWLEDLWVSIVQ